MTQLFSGKQPLPRPSWWTPETVLALLADGEPVAALCTRASDETEGLIRPRTLRTDITRWCQSATWGDRFQEALARLRAGRSHPVAIGKDWYDDFYHVLEETGGKIKAACDLVNVSPGIVYALRDRHSKLYDAEFDDTCRVLEGERFADIRESVLDQAALDGRLGQRVLESAMPSLHAPPHKIEVSGHVEVQHLLPPEVVAAAQTRARQLSDRRKLLSPPSASAPALPQRVRQPLTIDVSPSSSSGEGTGG